jgi:hypothetical protein
MKPEPKPCSHMDAYLPSHARNCAEQNPTPIPSEVREALEAVKGVIAAHARPAGGEAVKPYECQICGAPAGVNHEPDCDAYKATTAPDAMRKED